VGEFLVQRAAGLTGGGQKARGALGAYGHVARSAASACERRLILVSELLTIVKHSQEMNPMPKFRCADRCARKGQNVLRKPRQIVHHAAARLGQEAHARSTTSLFGRGRRQDHRVGIPPQRAGISTLLSRRPPHDPECTFPETDHAQDFGKRGLLGHEVCPLLRWAIRAEIRVLRVVQPVDDLFRCVG